MDMKKTTAPKSSSFSLKTQSLKKLSDAATAHVKGGQMMANPRTDCICCKACATMAC
jgi:hypothetical protein